MRKRIVSAGVVLLVTISAFATDRFSPETAQGAIATTARIIQINGRTRTMRVRGADGVDSPSQRSGYPLPGIVIPGGITIPLPAKPIKASGEYTVVTNTETAFQDGADNIHFEDFKAGETVSLRGVLSGTTLTASRVAKWD